MIVEYPEGYGPTPEQKARAVAAAAKRTVDPLRDWVRPTRDECPLCCVPYPMEEHAGDRHTYYDCCGKKTCNGCLLQRGFVSIKDSVSDERRTGSARSAGETWETTKAAMTTCPFCREGSRDPGTKIARMTRQAELGNADAMLHLAEYSFYGSHDEVPHDQKEGLLRYELAADGGSALAALSLGSCYCLGDAVDRDDGKALKYYRRAAELGLAEAYCFMGEMYMRIGEVEEAMLNIRRAAVCGFSTDIVFEFLMDGYRNEYITKGEYAYTLRENQASAGGMKSDFREMYKLTQNR